MFLAHKELAIHPVESGRFKIQEKGGTIMLLVWSDYTYEQAATFPAKEVDTLAEVVEKMRKHVKRTGETATPDQAPRG